MRRVLVSAGVALFVAAPAAAQVPTIDWSHTAVAGGVALPGEGPDGSTALQLRAAAPGTTSYRLVTIDHPGVTAPGYVIVGQVRYLGVEGQGYFEMWSVFPNGQRLFSRTLAADGALAALHGESSWRGFALPFSLSDTDGTPTRLEINLVLPGRGTVWLGPMRLERVASQAGGVRGAWWSVRFGSLAGAVLGSLGGVVGALIGVLGGLGRARRLVLSLLVGMVGVGGSLALLGAAAAWSSQPRYVWYPLLMIGGLAAVVGFVILPAVRRRYAADELRRIAAMDVGRRS
jgi:hypothetical protein